MIKVHYWYICVYKPYLYHGTSDKFIEAIQKEGLIPKSRLYVHLSPDIETAFNIGKRHGGKTFIITINALQMKLDGKKIYLSNNGVYSVESVEPKYFIKIEPKWKQKIY